MLEERPVVGVGVGEHQHHRVAGVEASYRHRVAGVGASCRAAGVGASCHLQLADLPRRRSAWLGTNC